MAGGKRLTTKKQPPSYGRNTISSTGRIHLIPYEDNGKIGTAVADFDENMSSPRHTQNNPNQSAKHSDLHYENKIQATSTPNATFKWGLAAVAFVLAFVIGTSIYDVIAPLVTFGILALSSLFTILPYLAKFFRWPIKILPPKCADVLGPIAAGILLAGIFVWCICGCGGFRLIKVPKADASSPSQAVEATTDVIENSPCVDADSPVQSEPSPSLPSTEGTTMITEPTIVTPHPGESDMAVCCVQKDFFSLIDYQPNSDDVHFLADDLTLWRTQFANEIKALVATKQSPGVDAVIRREYDNKTRTANDLYDQRLTRDNQIVANEDIIQLREDAYAQMPTLSVCDLLANDYLRLARCYKDSGNCENAYQSYRTAIEWQLTAVQFLDQIDDRFYNALFFIATTYYEIGDSGLFPDTERIDALYISACLFGATSQNVFASGDQQFKSSVYAGNANFALFNLTVKNSLYDGSVYCSAACDYYLKVAEIPSKNQKQIYGYLYELYRWAAQTSRSHPKELPLKEPSVYENLAQEYRLKSL